VHPSSILRAQNRDEQFSGFVADLVGIRHRLERA
jgi:hypothetical protein